MTKTFLQRSAAVLFLTALLLVGCKARKTNSNDTANFRLVTSSDSVSYAVGATNGAMFNEYMSVFPGAPIDKEVMLKAFCDAVRKAPLVISQEDANKMLETYLARLDKEEKETNKQKGETFLEANRQRPEVKTTTSGLQYEVLQEGKGIRPTVEDTVVVHYRGTTIDGVEFDSSYSRKQPATFGLLQVIPGWTEGICLLNEGAKAKLYIPYQLAYGERGAGQLIKPFSTLIFEVELLQVKKGAQLPVVNLPEKEPAKKASAKTAKTSKKKRK